MEANIEALEKLIESDFRGNESWFAEELGINRSYLNGIINRRKSARSDKLCLLIIKWCEKTGKDYKNYITFLNNSVQKSKQQNNATRP